MSRPSKLLPSKSENKPKEKEEWVKSFRALEKVLPYSRESFRQWSKLEGAPKGRSDGKQNLTAWKKFIEEQGLGLALTTPPTPRREAELIKRYQIQNERQALELGIRKRDYIHKSEVIQKVTLAWQEAHRVFHNHLILGIDSDEERKRNEKTLERAFQELHDLKNSFA